MIRKLTLATALTAAIAFPAMAQDVKAPAMGTPATATNAAPAQKPAHCHLPRRRLKRGSVSPSTAVMERN